MHTKLESFMKRRGTSFGEFCAVLGIAALTMTTAASAKPRAPNPVMSIDASNIDMAVAIENRFSSELDGLNAVRFFIAMDPSLRGNSVPAAKKAKVILDALAAARTPSEDMSDEFDNRVFKLSKELPSTPKLTSMIAVLNWERETVAKAVDALKDVAATIGRKDTSRFDKAFDRLSRIMDNYVLVSSIENEPNAASSNDALAGQSDPGDTYANPRDSFSIKAGPMARLRAHADQSPSRYSF